MIISETANPSIQEDSRLISSLTNLLIDASSSSVNSPVLCNQDIMNGHICDGAREPRSFRDDDDDLRNMRPIVRKPAAFFLP
jgi:hypothetical protein